MKLQHKDIASPYATKKKDNKRKDNINYNTKKYDFTPESNLGLLDKQPFPKSPLELRTDGGLSRLERGK
jgi:hypothetical protein